MSEGEDSANFEELEKEISDIFKTKNIFEMLSNKITSKYANYSGATAMTSEKWESTEARFKSEHPVWFFIDDVVLDKLNDIFVTIPDTWYWNIRRYFFDRYDMVKIKKIKRTQYSDITARLPGAMFELIASFYENEFDTISWYPEDDEDSEAVSFKTFVSNPGEDCHVSAARKIKRAYWFKKNFYDKYDELWDKYYNQCEVTGERSTFFGNMRVIKDMDPVHRFEAWYEKNEQRCMHYIVDVKNFLWS